MTKNVPDHRASTPSAAPAPEPPPTLTTPTPRNLPNTPNTPATLLTVDTTTRVGTFAVRAQFRAHAGMTVLFGPSGSGKSVTLATIAGLLRPETGRIVLRNNVLADAASQAHVATQDRHLGMVPQHPALLPHLSPLDNVALAARNGTTRADRRAKAKKMLALVEASHLENARTTSLSGGEQQRIALARALAGEPELLLLDEPFSALDRPTRDRLRQLLRALVNERELCAVLVTHDLEDVLALANRIVLFEPGTTVAEHEVRNSTQGGAQTKEEILGLLAGISLSPTQ